MIRDRLRRRVIPSTVVRLARVEAPARLRARVRRALGRPGRVELFFAFDDPCSAVAVLDLAERLAGRRVALDLVPVVERGIPGDPAEEAKRRYALLDAQRLARRSGRELARRAPLEARATAFLARWVAAAPPSPELQAFVLAAFEDLWLAGGAVDEARHAALWEEHLGAPPPEQGARALARAERRMAARGPYATPAAVVQGRWFFAHDRPVQIGEWLDRLGWRAAA